MKNRKKMKLWVKMLILAVVTVMLILLAVYTQVFVAGNTRSVGSSIVLNVEYGTEKIRIISATTSSATAYRGCKVRKDGDNIYIELKESLVDGAHKCGSAKLELVGDFTDVKNIYLEDDFDKKQIYPQNYGETIEQTLERNQWLGGKWETIEVNER